MRACLIATLLFGILPAFGWDYQGHRLVNQLALASLPTNYPAFVLTAAAKERIAFLAGEPDRWRNAPDLPLKHFNAPDHYLDLDDLPLYGLQADQLPPFRYDLVALLAVARNTNAHLFSSIDPAKDADHTRALVGFLPWTITEYYGKLRSGFSYLKAFEEAGTTEEIANAQQNIIHVMGTMGHFVGDGSQPLHTTKHFNGWVGPNPKNYPTNRTFHAWVDGGFISKAGLDSDSLFRKVRPARLPWPESGVIQTNIFPIAMNYLIEQFKLVEPLYQLEKDRKLSPGKGEIHEGQEFISKQLIKAGQMLGDLWFAAWREAPPDQYLRSQLARRELQTENPPRRPVPRGVSP